MKPRLHGMPHVITRQSGLMKTSRIARETAKVTSIISSADYLPRRQTRALAASLSSFVADDPPLNSAINNPLKREVSPKSSGLSSHSDDGLDIEDLPFGTSSSRKRKRGVDTLVSTVTSFSARKPGPKEETSITGKPKKAKRQPAKRMVGQAGEVKGEAPIGWEEIYNATLEMRKGRTAPVDTMGCETLAEEHLPAKDRRFQTLIALMLSSQTKDTTNAVAMRRLQTELPSPGLTLDNILDIHPVKLNELIYVVGFHNTKTKHIKMAAEILRDRFGGDIPDTIGDLMSLPGVGPKMAYLCMSAAWGRTEGIGVDVHVHRITNLWGWHKTKTPEETRILLQSWLPRDKWHEINHLLVGFGQTICTPVGRKCGDCKLSEEMCPSAVKDKIAVKKVSKKVTKTEA